MIDVGDGHVGGAMREGNMDTWIDARGMTGMTTNPGLTIPCMGPYTG